jgi:predicted RNA-binding Zn ribbon-like protein
MEKLMTAGLGVTPAHQVVVDFLNTAWCQGGNAVDRFCTDLDVVQWLEESGLASIATHADIEPGELLREARSLRGYIRGLISQWRLGLVIDLGVLNAYLDSGSYRIELSEDHEGTLRAVRKFSSETPQELLMGVALAAAELLEVGDFRFIRKCERDGCDVWFYDRTKNSSRKWCHTALCRNFQVVEQLGMRGNAD